MRAYVVYQDYVHSFGRDGDLKLVFIGRWGREGLHQGLDLGGDVGSLGAQSAISVPTTTALWWSRVPVMVWCLAGWRLHPWALSLEAIRTRPALLGAAGVDHAAMASRTASGSSQGPVTASWAGWIGVYRPRIRLALQLT